MKRPVMTISPDIGPDRIAGWYIFNTWLQKQWGHPVRLELFPSFQQQRAAIQRDEIGIIYANPFDAAMLVREKGFKAIAAAVGKSDEVVLAVHAESPIKRIEDLPMTCRAAMTEAPDVNTISAILLEPADITRQTLQTVTADTYVVVAKLVLQGKVDVGFFLAEAYDGLSRVVRSQLRELLRSQIHDIRHILLVEPQLHVEYETLRTILAKMSSDVKGRDALANLGFVDWELLRQEDTEFMIDLMDTLVT
ncbi:phosphonate transport system substrate-binding protein [Thiothrix eikelboomii]|uniref:Phosphonate transport system substrate-binding protein n=1 Tax=Thiothrix eikelboomii TaxID=92487 RepID=A0A1T4WQ38_9GAMM|nr:PhnD/SsuA/transferrin family substrate-binding protein [Thiothrix eikelboomii]SKA79463.1 phosphonate transport system substrate-binding protein [Thiothrix eikelboomii]